MKTLTTIMMTLGNVSSDLCARDARHCPVMKGTFPMRKVLLTWMVLWLFEVAQVMALNNCLTFDGVDDWVNTPTTAGIVAASNGTYTVECWVKCTSNLLIYKEILSQGSFGNAFYIGTDTNNNIRIGDGWTDTDVTFPFDDWHHFAVVVDTNQTTFYLDGTFKKSITSTIPVPASDTPFRIGRQYGNCSEYWPGISGLCMALWI